jgi:hypothetical protein
MLATELRDLRWFLSAEERREVSYRVKSDLEKFFSVLFQLLRDFREQMGALAWVALAMILVAGILLGVLALRWIRRGGLRAGAARRFFASRREIEYWLKTH